MRGEVNEQRLIARARQGDTAAFETLMLSHARFVYNLALRLLRDPHEAEDLSQVAFVRAWSALPRFRADSKFSTWLYRIVTNLCYNRLPRLASDLNALDPDEAVDLADTSQQVEEGLLSNELRAHLHAAIDGLPESYRLLITLRHLQGMSYEEIAESVRAPLGTVKTGIHRARQRLRAALEAYEADHG